VKPVDTTAAGDTFIGYLLAGIVRRRDVEEALRYACKAAAVCVTRPGAADSIPRREELEKVIQK
jgi:ribokinase